MGGIPIKYKAGSNAKEVEIVSEKKDRKYFNNKPYIMEESIFTDYAFIKAWKGDSEGNLVFKGSSNNFNGDMATAAKCVIAEVEEIVEVIIY